MNKAAILGYAKMVKDTYAAESVYIAGEAAMVVLGLKEKAVKLEHYIKLPAVSIRHMSSSLRERPDSFYPASEYTLDTNAIIASTLFLDRDIDLSIGYGFTQVAPNIWVEDVLTLARRKEIHSKTDIVGTIRALLIEE